jgi:MFS superfamily sulfate permease-like transporter
MFIGIGVKLVIHYINGMPLLSIFRPFLSVEQIDAKTYLIKASKSAVFSNWLLLRRQIRSYGILDGKNIVIDFSESELVDHSVMESLHGLQSEFSANGLELRIVGLDSHFSLSAHPESTRVRAVRQGSVH